jgi:UDP-galactopyranose mutase
LSSAPDVVVLGAGPAGLAVGLALQERALVLEQASSPGGLSRSIDFEGAVFDLGGHSFHTPHPRIRRLVQDSLELFEQQRDARCFSHGCMIRYPFQKHFRDLSDESVVRDCALGLSSAAPEPRAAHFLEFLERRFGQGIAQHFMIPYNRKLWGRDLTRLAADWVGERVAAPEGVDESFDEVKGERKPLQPETRVAYPAKGGFGQIMSALAARLPHLYCGQDVVDIDPEARTVSTRSGERHPWQRLVSTLPLPALLGYCRGVPLEIQREVALLEFLSLRIVLLVVDHPVDTEIQRIYCADGVVPAHKIALNHNSSDYLRALPRHGIMAEVSCANGDDLSDDQLVRSTISGLQVMRVLRAPSDVIASRVIHVKYAYPVPTLARDRIVSRARQWLREHHIETLGRFGEWAYINSDEAMHRGLRLGASL